jgi:type I restriction enzyme S subunit
MGRAPLVAFADICESVRYGYTASASGQEVGPRFLRITDIVPDSIDWDSVPFCEIDDSDKERFALEAGDIVVARTGATVGYAKMIRDSVDAVFASYLVRFRVDGKKADPGFVGRLVESFIYKDFVKSRVGGAAQPNANAQVLGSFQFRMPLRREQERIAGILSAYDDLIENNRRRMALLEEAARQLYREWFVRLRFPGHEHTRLLNALPEGWRRATAFDAMQVMSGGTPKTTTSDFWDGEIPFYTPKDSVTEYYVLDTEKHLTELGLNNCNSKLYPKDTVFITARGTVGNLNLAQRPMAMNQSCYALAGREEIPQKFLFCALREAIQHFQQHAVGAVFDAIIVDTFKLIPFVIPNPKLVRSFEENIEPMFRHIENLLQQNQKLKAARDLLLPRLMSGDLAS